MVGRYKKRVSIYCYYLVKDTANQQMKALWKWNSNEIVSQYTKMVFVAHLKYKMLQFNTWMWEMSWENEFKNNTAIQDR
jgi:hypothetical protein